MGLYHHTGSLLAVLHYDMLLSNTKTDFAFFEPATIASFRGAASLKASDDQEKVSTSWLSDRILILCADELGFPGTDSWAC